MVLKTFNVAELVYEKFSKFCKENGISMSKQIEIFMESQITEEPEVREEYLKKLEAIRKGKYHHFKTVAELKKAIESA